MIIVAEMKEAYINFFSIEQFQLLTFLLGRQGFNTLHQNIVSIMKIIKQTQKVKLLVSIHFSDNDTSDRLLRMKAPARTGSCLYG